MNPQEQIEEDFKDFTRMVYNRAGKYHTDPIECLQGVLVAAAVLTLVHALNKQAAAKEEPKP